jgi:hypothetical protein
MGFEIVRLQEIQAAQSLTDPVFQVADRNVAANCEK